MDEKQLWRNLAEEMIRGWDINFTGSGFMIVSDWRLPNDDRIEIYVRTIGEREDLFLVSDGGNLYNFLFLHGIDLNKDDVGVQVLRRVSETYGTKVVDFQIARGANDGDLHHAIRMVLEAIKDISYLMWRIQGKAESVH
ncbi:MAG: hypothetical protein AB2L11_02445 [Syntrophobacteraceae bacterium]